MTLRTVVLPIETLVRELDGTLWLAGRLARRGFRVAVGGRDELRRHWARLEPDLFFGDSAVFRRGREVLYRELRRHGVRVVVLDTEGGVFRSPEVYRDLRLHPAILEHVDLFLAWGTIARDLLVDGRGFPRDRAPVCGNPAFDLASPALRSVHSAAAERIRARHGRFVLFNTNFSLVNHFAPALLRQVLLTPDLPERRAHFEAILRAFIEAIVRVSRSFPALNVVVRPHPSENHTTYRVAFARCANVCVVHEGSVLPWILASRAVVHNSCTTAIESALLGRRVFAYLPVRDERFDLPLPNRLSRQVTEPGELCAALAAAAAAALDPPSHSLDAATADLLRAHVANVDGLASRRICAALGDAAPETEPEPGSAGGRSPASAPDAGPVAGEERAYRRQKFPGLSRHAVATRLATLAAHSSGEEAPRVEVAQGFQSVYWVTAREGVPAGRRR